MYIARIFLRDRLRSVTRSVALRVRDAGAEAEDWAPAHPRPLAGIRPDLLLISYGATATGSESLRAVCQRVIAGAGIDRLR